METFLIIYYVCAYAQTIPQIIKLIRTKSSNDFSLFFLTLQFIANTSWLIYVFVMKMELVFMIGSSIEYFLTCLNAFLVIHYYKRIKNKKSNH